MAQVALVTGGSRGIGRAICVKLASRGVFVYINYASKADAAEETLALCRAAGGDGAIIPFNVADSEAVEAAITQIKEKSGSLDILVNNAGITADGLVIRMKDEDWNKVLSTNLSGAFYCARAAAKIMMKARSGVIVNMASIVGQIGNAGQANYVAAKAGLIGLTKTLAKEFASRGIRVNAIAPGFIATDMTNKLSDEVKAEYIKGIPLARLGEPEDIANAVDFLTSDASSYITGQVLAVNGGMGM